MKKGVSASKTHKKTLHVHFTEESKTYKKQKKKLKTRDRFDAWLLEVAVSNPEILKYLLQKGALLPSIDNFRLPFSPSYPKTQLVTDNNCTVPPLSAMPKMISAPSVNQSSATLEPLNTQNPDETLNANKLNEKLEAFNTQNPGEAFNATMDTHFGDFSTALSFSQESKSTTLPQPNTLDNNSLTVPKFK